MLLLSAAVGVALFTLYPLGAAFANDHVEPERRVGLAAVLIMVYGVGACIGPLAAGALMELGGPGMFFIFASACALALVALMRPARVTGEHQVEEAPIHFVAAPDSLQSSPMAATLDPRADPAHDLYVEMVPVDNSPVTETAEAGGDPQHPGP